MMPGKLARVTSDAIPPIGTSTQIQILVSACDQAIVVVESTPVLTLFTETLAAELRVVADLKAYVSCVTRHGSGSAILRGTAYTTALV
jgi:hypothetical protein